MFEKGRKYMTATALIVLLAAGFAAALRPGIVIVKETGELYVPKAKETPQPPQLIGGQTDSHGCLIPAGFSWNETVGKCIRPWSGEIQLATGSVLVNISDPNWREKLQIPVGITTDVKCIDTDGGDVFTAGVTHQYGKTPRKDYCFRNRVKEWYCSPKDQALSRFVVCKKGCIAGACRPEIQKHKLIGPPATMPALNESLGISTEQPEGEDLILR